MARVAQYPVATMMRARELFDKSGGSWGPTRIQSLLDAEGLGRPSRITIQRWTNDAYRVAQLADHRAREAKRRAESAQFRLPSGENTAEYRRAFMQRLREGGVSCQSIAVVHGIVFGVSITEEQVRYIFVRDGDPKPYRTGRRAAEAARLAA